MFNSILHYVSLTYNYCKKILDFSFYISKSYPTSSWHALIISRAFYLIASLSLGVFLYVLPLNVDDFLDVYNYFAVYTYFFELVLFLPVLYLPYVYFVRK